ncbi:MAG: PHP domain-containing protein [Actinomycetales bacterium]
MIEPVDAMRRIAFLLERSGADTYRVQAFRGAATALLTTGEDEVRRRAADGTLTEIGGIGNRTAGVVREALAGRIPEYLVKLEESAGPLVAGGEAMRDALRGDLHSHSTWSDGGSPVEEMAVAALELGHEYLALTDHSPRLTVANGLTAARLKEQLKLVATVDERLGEFRLLSGIEVDILEDGGLDQEPVMLDRLDVVVASVHSKLAMERKAMTRRMLAAITGSRMNVLGHCTGRLVSPRSHTGKTRAQSQFDHEAVFAACAEHQVAVEINCSPHRLDPPRELMRMAMDVGCLFSIDTDAHAPGQLDWQWYGCARAVEVGVPKDRVVNTWPVDRLLEWSRAKVAA